MSYDNITTTTSRNLFSRIGGAIGAIVFGGVLFIASFPLLTWNEGRAIQRAKTLDAGASQVITVSADQPASENQGKLVHFTGTAAADGPVEDPVFGISADALKLRRDVEMFQWKQSEKSETKQKLGGGEETTTTYSYSKGWSSTLIDSSQFHVPAGHANPDDMPVDSELFVAEAIHVGRFALPESLVGMIENFSPRPVTEAEAKAAVEAHSAKIQATTGGAIFIGADPSDPQIGDARVQFQESLSGPVSIVAGQINDTLEPFAIKGLGTVELLQTGTFSAVAMFQQEQDSNAFLTWILRLAGFLMMLFGLLLMTSIFSVIASIIPIFGKIVEAGVGLIAIAIALPLSLVTIALSWLAFRPFVAIPILILAVALVILAFKFLPKTPKPAVSQ